MRWCNHVPNVQFSFRLWLALGCPLHELGVVKAMPVGTVILCSVFSLNPLPFIIMYILIIKRRKAVGSTELGAPSIRLLEVF